MADKKDAWNAFYQLELCERQLKNARENLDEHIYRTNALEKDVDEAEAARLATVADILERFEPIAEGHIIDCGTSVNPRFYRRTADGFELVKAVNVFLVREKAPADEMAEFAAAS